MTVLGLDPGINGGIAWITDGEPCVEKMPNSLQDLWDLLESILSIKSNGARTNGEYLFHAYLEQVASSPQMGVKSAFTFGNGFGQLEMALTAAHIPFTRVRPQVWQKSLGCLTKGDKNVTKIKAQELFPSMRVTHATADALLIAHYGSKQHYPSNNKMSINNFCDDCPNVAGCYAMGKCAIERATSDTLTSNN